MVSILEIRSNYASRRNSRSLKGSNTDMEALGYGIFFFACWLAGGFMAGASLKKKDKPFIVIGILIGLSVTLIMWR